MNLCLCVCIFILSACIVKMDVESKFKNFYCSFQNASLQLHRIFSFSSTQVFCYIFKFSLHCFFSFFCFNLKLHTMYELTCFVIVVFLSLLLFFCHQLNWYEYLSILFVVRLKLILNLIYCFCSIWASNVLIIFTYKPLSQKRREKYIKARKMAATQLDFTFVCFAFVLLFFLIRYGFCFVIVSFVFTII